MKYILVNKKLVNVILFLFLTFFFSSCCSAFGYWSGDCYDENISTPANALSFGYLADYIGGYSNCSFIYFLVNFMWAYLTAYVFVLGFACSKGADLEWANKFSDIVFPYILGLVIFIPLFIWITGWFDELNMLMKIVIGGVIALFLFRFRGIISPIANGLKHIAVVFCIIDFILGIIIFFYKTTK